MTDLVWTRSRVPTDDSAMSEAGNEATSADLLDEDELESMFASVMERTGDAVAAASEAVASETPGPSALPAAVTAAAPASVAKPREIVEAALFVAAEPVTARRLARLLETDDIGGVEEVIDALNADYDAAGRAYEIRLRDGGYRMQLRHRYEPTCDRLYGRGPREVTLPPEVVEMLALVAYEQPVGRDRVASLPRKTPKRLVGQLIRRGLVELRETEGEKSYVTTDRFLDVLGLREIDDLPQPEVLSIR